MKIIEGNFGENAPKGKGKINKAVKKLEASGLSIDDSEFVLIVDFGGELKVASDLDIEKLTFVLEVIKYSVLTGSYEI